VPFSAQDVARITATSISGHHGVGALLRPVLHQLGTHPGQYQGAATRASSTALDLITMLLGERLGASMTGSETERRSLLFKIEAHIEANLGHPDLSPASVAGANYISLRSLHKLFEGEETTVGQMIRDRRLERCRRDIADPALAHERVRDIAARHGLLNPAHFSQQFRERYGESPSELRDRTVR
jgi:AraC-like DNA-binding protein